MKDDGEDGVGRASHLAVVCGADTCERWTGRLGGGGGGHAHSTFLGAEGPRPSGSLTGLVAASARPVAGPACQQREVQAASLLAGGSEQHAMAAWAPTETARN